MPLTLQYYSDGDYSNTILRKILQNQTYAIINGGGGGGGTPGGVSGDWQINTAGSFAGIAPAAGWNTVFSTPTSANLAAWITDETGTGALVFGTSPTIAAPTLTGTTTVATANATTLNATNFTFNSVTVTGPTGTGNMVLGTSPTLVTPALGTPTALVLTNATGLPMASLVAGILAGNMTLGESTGQIVLDPTLSADGTWSGIMEAGTAGTTLAFGDLVYFQASDSRWELVDADASATSGPLMLGMCVLAAASDGSATNILRYGKIRADANFPTLTIGAPAYASGTPGDITVTQPSATDAVIRIVGHAITADALLFNPSNDWMIHT